ncbi:MAG: NAD-dependent epimerase/dehydratase family protein [Candidatus Actinomarina sp.]|jgi:dihydroflavonol-4-reductase|tara:strand:+ start:3434 stop:4438 length:1005 start_codon:yes stop_codon:yes gene_type:complete
MKFKNIFITGSSGVVGKPIFLKLINEGHNVFALTRNNKNEEFIWSNNGEVITGDLFSENIYSQLEDKSIDAIFHVAGANQKCQKDPSLMHKTNIEGTKKMLELGNNLKIKKFIYTSSAVTLGEQKGKIGNENSDHRGSFLSDYEESKFLAEQVAFAFNKNFEFVSINPSSVQGPGRISGTAKLLISTLNKKYPPLIKSSVSVVDIDDCTEGHYLGLINGKNNEKYVLNSFRLNVETLIENLKYITSWKGTPVYIPKRLFSGLGPVLDVIGKFSSLGTIICSETIRVLTHGHLYDGSKASKELGLEYTAVDTFISKTISWLNKENLATVDVITHE